MLAVTDGYKQDGIFIGEEKRESSGYETTVLGILGIAPYNSVQPLVRYSEDRIEKVNGRSYPLTPAGEYLNPNQTEVNKIFDNNGVPDSIKKITAACVTKPLS